MIVQVTEEEEDMEEDMEVEDTMEGEDITEEDGVVIMEDGVAITEDGVVITTVDGVMGDQACTVEGKWTLVSERLPSSSEVIMVVRGVLASLAY